MLVTHLLYITNLPFYSLLIQTLLPIPQPSFRSHNFSHLNHHNQSGLSIFTFTPFHPIDITQNCSFYDSNLLVPLFYSVNIKIKMINMTHKHFYLIRSVSSCLILSPLQAYQLFLIFSKASCLYPTISHHVFHLLTQALCISSHSLSQELAQTIKSGLFALCQVLRKGKISILFIAEA